MSLKKLVTEEYQNYNQFDADAPTFSFTDGRSVAIQQLKHKKSRIIFVKDKMKQGDDYIPEVRSNNGEFHQIPDITAKRDCLYICAPNQAGKTTYLSKYISYFRKVYPKRKIYLFSSQMNDPILDKFKPIRVELNAELITNKISPVMLQNSMVIFDDIDKIRDKKVKREVYDMIEEILVNGAHNNLSIAITHHLMTDYKNTRIILNECSSITFFPRGGSAQQIRYTLKNYYGLSKKQIETILKLKSRWVTLFRAYPQVVLYSKGIYLL